MEHFGFLLLSSHLGNPQRKPLTVAQMRILSQRVLDHGPFEEDRKLTQKDLLALGYSRNFADQIVSLLEDRELLERYLQKGKARRCVPITRQDPRYPQEVRRKLGKDSPGCLWAKGDLSLLDASKKISAVGCRSLNPENRAFAREIGAQAARQGYVLVSGNAVGADQAAQESCLSGGGQVISVVPDALHSYLERPNVLYLSEEDYDASFSTLRALRRNRVIHALGVAVAVAQCRPGNGGTWSGTNMNLQNHWTPVYMFRDGSEGAAALNRQGAELIGKEALLDLSLLSGASEGFLQNL